MCVCYFFISVDIFLFTMKKRVLPCSQIITLYINWVLKYINYSKSMSGLEIMIIYIVWWCG